MPLSNKFRRLALLMEPDVQRMLERHAQRVAGHDGVRYDERANVVTYTRQGSVLAQPRAERIGEWSRDLAVFKWWFTGIKFGEHAHKRLDVAYREGEQFGMSELTTETLTVETAADADTVAHVAAQLARADGVLRATQGDRVIFFALFDSKGSDAPHALDLRDTAVTPSGQRPAWMQSSLNAFSVAPPAVHERVHEKPSLRPGPGSRTIPPLAPIEVSSDDGFGIPPPPRAPTANLPIRDPARTIFMPLAQLALGDVAATVPGFGQALLVIRIDNTSGNKGRYVVQLVALDPDGDLIALDPSRALLEAAGKMIADDVRDGNGRWLKLAARLRPTERGASVDLDVV